MQVWFEKFKPIIIGFILVVIIVVVILSKLGGNSADVEIDIPTVIATGHENERVEDDDEETSALHIVVDIKGAIQKPGIYRASEGDRVFDIIEMSGGLKEDADEMHINLAEKVYDEMVIYVPYFGEIDEPTQASSSSSSLSSSQNGKINLNKASQEELETLPGIGPAKAQAILEYREQVGVFKDIEELKNISGIGEKTFERLQDDIAVK